MTAITLRPSRATSHRRHNTDGFTLIELLIVVAIIIALLGIVIGISGYVLNKDASSRARGEMDLMAQALDNFKSEHGDYPWADNSGNPEITASGANSTVETANANLLDWLTGWRTWDYSSSPPSPVDASTRLKGFIEINSLTIEDALGDDLETKYKSGSDTIHDTAPSDLSNPPLILDPWGNPYVYMYEANKNVVTSSAWASASFILISAGPDGLMDTTGISNDGTIDLEAHRNASSSIDYRNLDNIVFGYDD